MWAPSRPCCIKAETARVNISAGQPNECRKSEGTIRHPDLCVKPPYDKRMRVCRCRPPADPEPIPITGETGCHSQDPMVASFCRRSHFDLRKERLHVSIPSCLKIGRSPRRADVLFDHAMTWRQLSLSHLPGSSKLCSSLNWRWDAAGLS